MSDTPPFDRLQDAPEGNEFGQFLQQESQKERFNKLRDWLDERNLSSEEELLSSFSYISGGFTVDIPDILVSEGITSLQDAATADNLYDLLDGNYSSTHRRHPEKTPDALTTFYENISPTFSNFLDEVKESEDPFNTALSRLEPPARHGGVESFGRLAAFDWLETLVRVHGFEWLAPNRLLERHLTSSSGPKTGFKEVFDISLGDDHTENCLRVTEQFAQNELDLPDTKRVFEIESAFCNYQDLDEGQRQNLDKDC